MSSPSQKKSPSKSAKYTEKENEIERHYEWLEDIRLTMSLTVEHWEPLDATSNRHPLFSRLAPESPYYQRSIDAGNWFEAKRLQSKADEEAKDLGIPISEVPQIMEIWNERCITLGKGSVILLL
jgi:hypothetical protein